MLNAVPLPTGPPKIPGGSANSERNANPPGGPGDAEGGNFAATLEAVSGHRRPGAGESRRPAEDAAERPVETEASDPSPDDDETADATTGAAAIVPPAQVTPSWEGPLGGQPTVPMGEDLRAAEPAAAGQPVPQESLPNAAGNADAAPGMPQTATGESTGKAGQGDGDEQALLPGAPGKGATDPEAQPMKALRPEEGHDALRNTPEDAARTVRDHAAATPADPQAGEQDAGATNPPAAHAVRRIVGHPGDSEPMPSTRMGRADAPDPTHGSPGSELPAEPQKSFGDVLRETAPAIMKEDSGPLAARPGGADGNSPFLATTFSGAKAMASAAGGESASAAAPDPAESFSRDNFHQMVERVLVSARGGQSEARIALKPDELGHVRMQILTENHQVSIRIVTESPAARDLIDASAHQLKNELQQQGLNVESIEVSVSDEERDADRGARHREAFLRHMNVRGRLASETEGPYLGPASQTQGFTRASGIDYFA